jgi:hypothetical protein
LHAPAPVQSVAPHVALAVEHAAVQQWPEPAVPQTPLVHWLLLEHAAPLLSVETQVPLAPGFWQ